MLQLRKTLTRTARTTSAAIVVVLALMTAAYAAVGDAPLRGAFKSDPPVVGLSGGTGFQLAAATSVTWSTGNMVPGDVSVSQITVSNEAGQAADLRLTASGLVDVPAAPAQTLSSALRLRITDITTPASPVTVYDGSLAAISVLSLGRWFAGASRTYRFTTTFPDDRSDSLDNELQDATTTIQYSWDGFVDDGDT